MKEQRGNSCAVCGVPIKPGRELCAVCARESTARTSMVPCRACGAANPSGGTVCGECGAPLNAPPASPRLPAGRATEPLSVATTARRAELTVLEDCFKMCLTNRRAGGAIVAGEAGMGASTLLKGFAERVTAEIPKRRVFFVQCRETGEPFGPIRGVLRQAFELDEDVDPTTRRLQLTSHVGKLLGPGSAALVTETTHILGYLAGVPFPQSPVLKALEADGALMERRIKETLTRFLAAYVDGEPAVFVFDDFHKVQAETQKSVVDLFVALPALPVTLVLGGRPELAAAAEHPSVVRINLEPLEDDVMRRLFSLFLPLLVEPPEELIDATVGRAAGNPGSLHELCALLIESGVIDTRDEPWTADVTKLAKANMPVNLLDALKARIEQLDTRDRAVLQHAAAFGEVFWDEAVVAMSRLGTKLKKNIGAANIWADDSDGLAISSSLDRLVERQFIVQLPDADIKGCLKYAFARSGIREAIMEGMKDKERTASHYLAAAWLEHAAEIPLFAEIEAAHWQLAGESHRAALAFMRAARHARSRYLNQKAVKLFRKGLELAEANDRITLIDALHDLGSVHELLGLYEDAEGCFTEMLRHAWIVVHRGKAGAALNKIGRLYRARGDAPAARAFLNRGMTLFKAAGDEKGVAACLGDLGELARRQGSYDRAFKLVTEALSIQRKLDNKPSIAVCLHTLGAIEAARASYTQAEQYLEEALDWRRQAGDKGGMAQTLSTLAIVLFNRSDLDRAIARWEAALGLAEEVGDRRMLAIVHNNLGEALRDQGKLERSMRHFKACEEVVTTLADRLLHAEVSRNIGILSQKMGDLETARRNLQVSLHLAQELGGKEMEGLAHRALGELASATMWDTSNVGGVDEAEAAFERALDIFRSIGNEFEVARTLHAQGNRLLERGDVDGGKKRLEEAKEIFQRIDSKASEKVSRTIKEITDQSGVTDSRRAAPVRKPASRGLIKNPLKRSKEIVPDMTSELDDDEEE